jgi:hypothetical protein
MERKYYWRQKCRLSKQKWTNFRRSEYLTVFDGLTGKAFQTIDYIPQRGSSIEWVTKKLTDPIAFWHVLPISMVLSECGNVPRLLYAYCSGRF